MVIPCQAIKQNQPLPYKKEVNIITKYIGNTYKNNDGHNFTVKEISHRTAKSTFYKVKFNSGYIAISTPTDFTRGRVKDYLSPSQANIGTIGYANIKLNKRATSVWRNMINRCYNPNFDEYKRYGEKGVFVNTRWLRLDYFLEDLKKIDGYNNDLFEQGKIQLDKDTKFEGNLEYSLDKCRFVSPQENSSHALGISLVATNKLGRILTFSSVLECSRHFNVHRGIIERRLDKKVDWNGWLFYRRCND